MSNVFALGVGEEEKLRHDISNGLIIWDKEYAIDMLGILHPFYLPYKVYRYKVNFFNNATLFDQISALIAAKLFHSFSIIQFLNSSCSWGRVSHFYCISKSFCTSSFYINVS